VAPLAEDSYPLPVTTTALEQSIDDAWRVFGSHRVTNPVAVCAHCTTDRALEAMVRTPVREWPDHLVAEHEFAVAVAVIDFDVDSSDDRFVDQQRAVLPRYLRYLADGHGSDATMAPYGALRYRERWNDGEVAALDDFYRALIRDSVDDRDGAVHIALSGGASSDLAISEIDRLPEKDAADAIAEMLPTLIYAHGSPHFTIFSEVGTCRLEADRMRDWLLAPVQRRRIETAIDVATVAGDDRRYQRLWRGLLVQQAAGQDR